MEYQLNLFQDLHINEIPIKALAKINDGDIIFTYQINESFETPSVVHDVHADFRKQI